MNIGALRAAIAGGMELQSHSAYVTTGKAYINKAGKTVAPFSVKIYRKNAGRIELASSDKRAVPVGNGVKGTHSGAEKALAKLGYELLFIGALPDGCGMYAITNL